MPIIFYSYITHIFTKENLTFAYSHYNHIVTYIYYEGLHIDVQIIYMFDDYLTVLLLD